MKVVKKIVHILANICYIAISVYVLITLPIIFGYRPLVVLSGSMEKTYPVGSIIYYHEVSQDELKEKDVITYEMEDGKYITHRIEKIIDGSYETKGDANNVVDAKLVEFSQIKGKATSFYIPYIGNYVEFVNKNIICIFIAGLILVSEFILQNIKSLDIDKGRNDSKNEK